MTEFRDFCNTYLTPNTPENIYLNGYTVFNMCNGVRQLDDIKNSRKTFIINAFCEYKNDKNKRECEAIYEKDVRDNFEYSFNPPQYTYEYDEDKYRYDDVAEHYDCISKSFERMSKLLDYKNDDNYDNYENTEYNDESDTSSYHSDTFTYTEDYDDEEIDYWDDLDHQEEDYYDY